MQPSFKPLFVLFAYLLLKVCSQTEAPTAKVETEATLNTAHSDIQDNLKVMHASTFGDARIAPAYSVVIGQIHGNDGHENELHSPCAFNHQQS